MISVLTSKNKRTSKGNIQFVGIALINGDESLTGEEREILRKRVLTSKEEKKYKIKYFQKPSLRKHWFFRKAAYCPVGKNNCKCWACGEVEHYTNECKNKKNSKLIETLGSLDYFEISEEEALDLALNNNKELLR